ncbi:hypothetical protein EON65_30115 [archaeon]|nr:MAG: hypothetical protein EON65_30115 [archaeon]
MNRAIKTQAFSLRRRIPTQTGTEYNFTDEKVFYANSRVHAERFEEGIDRRCQDQPIGQGECLMGDE